jgi:hypothetical protein
MTLDEFQQLDVGDQVMVHYARHGNQLLSGAVVSQARFAMPMGIHVGVKLIETGETVYPPCERVHRFPLGSTGACRFCATFKQARRSRSRSRSR